MLMAGMSRMKSGRGLVNRQLFAFALLLWERRPRRDGLQGVGFIAPRATLPQALGAMPAV